MDEKLTTIAQGALRILGPATPASRQPASNDASCAHCGATGSVGELRLLAMSLAQLSHLAYLQAGDPLVDQVIEALRLGRPVHLDRPTVEDALGLKRYPPRMQETFARWFVRISGFGVHLTQSPALKAAAQMTASAAPPAPTSSAEQESSLSPVSMASPEKTVLSDILGETCSSDHPCIMEPGRPCTGTGRCKEFGF